MGLGHTPHLRQLCAGGHLMLTFPTLAEQALTEWRAATRTIALATIARRRGAQRIRNWQSTEWIFDDDTSLVVTGTGRNHKVVTELP